MPDHAAGASDFPASTPGYGAGAPTYGAGAPGAVPAAGFAGAPGYGAPAYGPALAFAQSAPSDPGPYPPGPYPPGHYPPGPYGPGPYGPGPYGPGPYGPGPYGHQPPPGWGWPSGGYPPPPPRKPPRSAEERRRRRRFSLALAAIVVVAIGAGIGIGAAVAPTSPTAVAQGLVHQAVTAATNAGSFRYTEVSTASGPAGEQILGDAGRNGGRQEITQQGANGLDRFTLRLVNGVVYFKGNAAAVVDQLGVPATKATKVSAEWVKVVKGDAPYKTFEPGITATSNIAQLKSLFVATSSRSLAGSKPAATEVDGGINTGKGHAVGTAHLVLATATSRPERFTAVNTGATGAQAVSLHWRFGHYGEKVNVSAPSGAVPYSSLGATPPNKTGKTGKTASKKG